MRKNEPFSHTYGRTTRFIAFLLAFVIIFGLMPFSSFPVFAAAPDNMPETITLMDANSGGYGVKNYQSPNGLGTCGIHSFTMDVGDGAAMIGFCCAHDKALNDNYRGHPWHFTSKVNAGDAANHPYLPFLDWWMYRMEVSWGLDLQYPDKTEEEKQAMDNDYMNEWERQYTNAWVQATIWLTIAGVFTNCDDPEQIKKVAAERDAVLRAFDIDVDASPWPSETLLTEWRDKWKNGDYNKRNYYLYTPESDYVQPILITQVFPEDEDVEDSYGYIQVEKTDQSGTPLKNATFTIYADSSCTKEAGTIITNESGHGVSQQLSFNSDSFTFYVKETSAPSGYTGSSQVYQVTVSATANNTPETAAKVNGGNPVINTTGPGPEPSTPESVIRKVDQDGNGIGPATFRLKSLENGIEMEVSCDVTGSLELQWTNKSGDNYIEPGEYTVTEITPPPGYEKTDEAKNLRLWIETGSGGEQIPRSSGPLTFTNNKKPSIIISKIDASGKGLAGAAFDIYYNGKLVGSATTGNDGTFTYMGEDGKGLGTGYYEFVETKAPEGYLLDSTKHKIEVKDFEVTLVELENYEKAGLTIQKVDAESKIPLSGATFGVYDMHGALLKNVTTNSSGIASVNGLQPGWYKVIELGAPLGYILDSQEHLVEIVEGKPATITVANTPQSGITVKKVDATNKEPLAGAVFELYTADDTLVGTYTTDKSGSFVTDKVEPGTYFLVETKAPEGYVIDTESTKVIVKENENPVVTIENHKGTTIQILKTDAVTGAYLEGAEFEVWTLNCTKLLGTYVTDKTGMVYTDPLPAGNYVVIESKAPQGYALDDTHHHVNLTYDHPYILKVSDQPLTAIMITKVSTVDDEPLLGAKFQVRTAEGDVIGEYTTDTTGTATTPILEPGVYYVKEVEAPDGYLLNDQVFRVEVKAGTMATLVVEDTPEASLVIFKGDSNTKKGIAGAVFKVETADGDFIGQYTTDAQGEALIRPIAPGHYIVTEMSAPEGYLVSETPKTITVKAGVVNRVEFMDAEKGSLIIRLEDQADGHKLENGRFELYWAATGEKVAEGVTDNAGSIVWGSLNPGRYIIKHTFAPDGYTIVDEEKEGIVVSGDTKIVVFQDCTAGLVIEKLDKLTTEPLAGARFQVTRNSDHIVIGEYVTDNDGLTLVSGLIPGMYTVEEIEAPDGYAIDEPSRLVHVKAGQQAHVTFTDTPFAGITINAVDKDNNKPLSGIVFEVWHQNGELVNTYTTDSTGMIQTDKLTAGYYTIKVIKTENGYTAVTSEQTVQIKDGIVVTAKFEFIARGILQIYALNSKEQGLPGMKVTITKQNGEFVGNYTADGTGLIKVPNLEPGWYVVTETQAPDGYTIDGEASQSIQVTSNGDTILKFYHGKTYGVQIRTSVKQTGEMVPGVVYQITKLDGSVVGSYTSDQVGLVYVSLEPGWYVIKQTSLPEGFKNYSLCGSRNIEVKADTPTVVDFQLTQLSSIRVKFVDGSTDAAIYGVHVLLKDSAGTIVDEYVSDNEGYITLKQSVVNGTYTLQQIAVPNGYYTVDSVPKTIEVLNGETTEIVWRMYNQAGQIQVHVTSSAYNSTLDLAAGSNLQGAVFEIYNPFTYAVVATITSDSYGVAASNGGYASYYRMLKEPYKQLYEAIMGAYTAAALREEE